MRGKTAAILLGCLAAAAMAVVFAVVIPRMARTNATQPNAEPNEPAVSGQPAAPIGTQLPADGTDAVGFVAQYIRTDGYHDGAKYPQVTIIRSAEELNAYYEANRGLYSLERRENPGSDFTVGFLDACDKYDEAYFQSRILLLVLLEEGSGSVRHRVAGVTWGDEKHETLHVEIEAITPEAGTCDMAEWHIFIEPEPGADVADESCVTVDRRSAEETRSGLAFCAADGVSAALRIPEGWTFDVDRYEDSDSSIACSIAFRPAGREGRILLSCSRFLGVCGTGLKQEKVTLAGYEAWKGTYDGKKLWDFFTIQLGEALKGVAIWNEGMSGWSRAECETAMEILETLAIGDGRPTEEQAVEIAKSAVTVPYDYTRALYNEQEGVWTVAFGRKDYAGGDQLVTVNDAGEVVDSVWGE